ncbi:hypothetical protein GQ600_14250 [Phytophthora cactorum]|nr:hypothetical protein GQ600_14250 [Phytophthora cactorum]
MKAPKGYAKVAGAAEPAASHIGCKEYLMTVSSRLYFSSFYRLVYFFMIASSVVCVAWVSSYNWDEQLENVPLIINPEAKWVPSSVVFISLEITVSALLVFEVLLRMMAFKRCGLTLGVICCKWQRFWHKWCNIFDIVALADEMYLMLSSAVMSLVSVVMYFNEGEGVLGELEEVAADSVLALRNAVQYVRLAIFLKNRSDQPTTIGKDIDFEELAVHPDDEREMMLNAESGMGLGSDDEEEIRIV